MRKTTVAVPLILFLVIAGAIGAYVYYYWFDMYRNDWISIPVDQENDLAVVGISPRRGDLRRYAVRRNPEKKIIWKTRLEKFNYQVASFGEERLRRDVMLMNGAVSLLYASESRFYKFDWETGEILSTLDLQLPSGQTSPWLVLQDGDSLYVKEAPNRDNLIISAINFDDFTLRWSTEELEADLISQWNMPFQNESWLVFHRRTLQRGEILAIDKNTGEHKELEVDIPGFLKGDSYYFLKDNRDTTKLCRWELRTGEREILYLLEENLSRSELFENYPALWHRGEDRIFTLSREDDRSFLIARDLETGNTIWSLPLPEHYIHSTRILGPTLLESAPEFSFYPEIKSRCLPLLLIDPRKGSAGEDSYMVKYWIVDLEKGKVIVESRGVEQNLLSYTRSMEDGMMYLNGRYHLTIPIPDTERLSLVGLMTIDGETGDVESVVLPGLHMKGGDMPMDDYVLTKAVPSPIPGRTFTFKDGTVIDLENRSLRGRESENYYLKDISEEMERLYGF